MAKYVSKSSHLSTNGISSAFDGVTTTKRSSSLLVIERVIWKEGEDFIIRKGM
jgi:hypothetical protein